jgi:ribokinase
MDGETGEGQAPPRIFVAASFVMACCWSVDRLPQPGETRTATALGMEPGGKGFNVAVGTRRLGACVDVLVGVGRDAAGRQLRDVLQVEGIGAEHAHGLSGQSGYGAGLIGENGQNAIAVFPGPNLLLTAAHANAAESDIARAALVYGQFETSLEAVTRSFEIARRHGVRTVLNPSPWRPIPSELLAATSVIVLNEVEAAGLLGLCGGALAGLSASAVAALLKGHLAALWSDWKASGELLLVVTLGEHGCAAFRPRHAPVAVPAFVVEAVDTVGAGDAFASALCMALCRKSFLESESDLESALARANAAGALMASQRGVLGVLPTAWQLDARLEAFRLPEAQASSLIL